VESLQGQEEGSGKHGLLGLYIREENFREKENWLGTER
jgi:hypothetical protein